MRSNKVRALVVAVAASALALVVASSAAGLVQVVTTQPVPATDASGMMLTVESTGNAGSSYGNLGYWTSPIDSSGLVYWFNKPVRITDFAFPDTANGPTTFQSATFGRNIGAGYSAQAPLAGQFVLSYDGVYSIVATGNDTVDDIRGEVIPAFGIDQQNPVVTTDRVPFYTGNPTVTVTATDTISGISGIVFDVNGVANDAWAPEFPDPIFSTGFSFFGEGIHSFSWTAFDNAGNEVHGSEMFTIDNTPPSTVSDAGAVYNGPAVIHLTATDSAGGSGVAHTYYILDGAPQVEGTTVNVPAPVNGSVVHTIEFWSVDGVGLVEVHVSGSFTVNSQHTITATQSAHGSVAPAGTAVINLGAGATYTITPDVGYHIADVNVDGVSVGAVGTYTFTNVTANRTIAATFAANAGPVSTTGIRLSSAQVLYGARIFLTGTVQPNAAGQRVTLQRRSSTSTTWVNLTNSVITLNSSSVYYFAFSTTPRGTWYFRTVYPGTSTVAGSTSVSLRLIVR